MTTHKIQDLPDVTNVRSSVVDDRFDKGRRGYASQALERTRQCHQIEARCITEEASICLHCDMFLFWRDTRSTWKASWRRRGNQATVVRDERTDEKNDIVRTRAYYPFQREERRRTREKERKREEEVDKKRERRDPNFLPDSETRSRARPVPLPLGVAHRA